MKKKGCFYFTIFLIGIILIGCTNDSTLDSNFQQTDVRQRRQKYVGIFSLSEIDYFTDHKLGLFKAAEYLDVDVEYLSSVGNDEIAMRKHFENAISEQVDGIILLGTAESCKDYIDVAAIKGIPTVLVEGDIPNSRRIGVVGTNNYEAGRTGAKIAVEILSGLGQVAFITQLNTNVHQERVAGYMSVFDNYPGIEVISLKDTMFSYEEARKAVREMMEENTDIDLIIGTDYYGGPAAVIALKELAINDVKIISMDRSSMTIEGILNDKIYATLGQQTSLMSFYAVRLLYDFNNATLPIEWMDMGGKEAVPINIQTGVTVITKNDITHASEDITSANKH